MNLFVLLISCFCSIIQILPGVYATGFEGHYHEYGERRLDLIELFLPEDPLIFKAGGHLGEDSVKMAEKWPNGLVYSFEELDLTCVVLDDWCKENGIDHIDFMRLDLEGLELQVLKSSPEILKTVRVIHTETHFRQFCKEMTLYRDLRRFLEEAGFKLVAHWYTPGMEGDAIFVRRELTDGKLPSDRL